MELREKRVHKAFENSVTIFHKFFIIKLEYNETVTAVKNISKVQEKTKHQFVAKHDMKSTN